MALRVEDALNKLKDENNTFSIEIIKTKSFKEKKEFDVNECYVIKQELVDDILKLTVAYFDI